MTSLLALTLTATLSPAAPQPQAPTPLLTQAVTLTTISAASPLSTSASAPGGDSLKNGAIIGAIAGGLATGAVVGALCYAFNDGDDRGGDCAKATLLWTGIGAAGGAALGAGVDALFARAPGARATRIAPAPSLRLRFRF